MTNAEIHEFLKRMDASAGRMLDAQQRAEAVMNSARALSSHFYEARRALVHRRTIGVPEPVEASPRAFAERVLTSIESTLNELWAAARTLPDDTADEAKETPW